MRRNLKIPPKEELQEKYFEFGATLSSLGREYNTSHATIRSWLKKYDISLKTHKQASAEVNVKNQTINREIPSRKDLEDFYSKNSLEETAKNFNCNTADVSKWLEHYGIKKRTLSDGCLLGKSKVRERKRPSKEDLISLYDNIPNKSYCCEHFGISKTFMDRCFKEYEIETVVPWRSQAEISLFEFCKETAPEYTWVANDKTQINPFELDIYCPELKLAIEYCGVYWHSEYHGNKKKTYHKDKLELCESKGIRLITVFEYDDLLKVQRLLKHILGKSKRIFARKTFAKKIESSVAREFHEKYHLHDSVEAKYHYGLYHDDILVMVASFGKNRFSKECEYELARMTLGDYAVVGGFSKLLKRFVEDVSPKSVVTFADRRFGSGGVYRACGMDFVRNTPPGYYYFHKDNPCTALSRVQFQKHKLVNKLDNFDSSLTEFENMVNNGYDRVFDCGHAKYVLDMKKGS